MIRNEGIYIYITLLHDISRPYLLCCIIIKSIFDA